jgi:hypothetical protein
MTTKSANWREEIETLLNAELGWCIDNPMTDKVDKKYREGFISGIKQAKRIIKRYAISDLESKKLEIIKKVKGSK